MHPTPQAWSHFARSAPPPPSYQIKLDPSLVISALTFDKPIYIMGDFNCNILNNETRNSKALLDFCRPFNFSQLITSPTRTTDVSKSLLDIILASNLKQVQKAKVLRSSISDHDLVFAVLRLKKARPKTTYIATRSFKNYNPDAFSNDVSQIPWSRCRNLRWCGW